jgi:hypothetical protein
LGSGVPSGGAGVMTVGPTFPGPCQDGLAVAVVILAHAFPDAFWVVLVPRPRTVETQLAFADGMAADFLENHGIVEGIRFKPFPDPAVHIREHFYTKHLVLYRTNKVDCVQVCPRALKGHCRFFSTKSGAPLLLLEEKISGFGGLILCV